MVETSTEYSTTQMNHILHMCERYGQIRSESFHSPPPPFHYTAKEKDRHPFVVVVVVVVVVVRQGSTESLVTLDLY